MYDLARYKFLMHVVTQLPHLSLFCASRDIHYRSVILLRRVYVGDSYAFLYYTAALLL
jgi:hypothetical protein